MSTMTIRYDEKLEPMIDEISKRYGISTKNKAIVKVIECHIGLINTSNFQSKKIEALEQRVKFLTDVIKQKIKADDMLARVDLSNW